MKHAAVALLCLSLALFSCGPTEAIVSVSLDKHELDLIQGDTYKLEASISHYENMEPDLHVTWESSDPIVASVDGNGLVYAYSAGTAVITVITVEGGKTDTCEVSVSAAVTVDTVTIDSIREIGLGIPVVFPVTVEPENATDKYVYWSSSDTNIATVDSDGRVTGLAEGTVSIWATARSGGGSISCECILTVSPIPLNDFSVTGGSVAVNETLALALAIDPPGIPAEGGATHQEFEWVATPGSVEDIEPGSGDGAASVDQNGLVTGLAAGPVEILVRHIASGMERTCAVTVTP